MVRTFIAAELDGHIRKALEQDVRRLAITVPRVNWSRSENLHLTFRFLGDVKENDLQELFDAIESGVTGIEPFALEVRDIGVFPSWRQPRVVWAGCGAGAQDAIDLAAKIEDACVDLGYERERRLFRPHLTLGRVKLPADAVGLEEAVADLGEREYGFMDVDRVAVFMSSLRRTGPVYSPMFTVELGR